jgi:hypothetical protein
MEEGGSCKTWLQWRGDLNLKIGAYASSSYMGDGEACSAFGQSGSEVKRRTGKVLERQVAGQSVKEPSP